MKPTLFFWLTLVTGILWLPAAIQAVAPLSLNIAEEPTDVHTVIVPHYVDPVGWTLAPEPDEPPGCHTDPNDPELH